MHKIYDGNNASATLTKLEQAVQFIKKEYYNEDNFDEENFEEDDDIIVSMPDLSLHSRELGLNVIQSTVTRLKSRRLYVLLRVYMCIRSKAARVIDGKTYLHFPLEREEQIYGFGLNFQTVHQRGRIMELHVDHYGGRDNGRTHAPTPFYVSSNGYGVFVNSARYIKVYAGTEARKDSKNPPVARDRNTDKSWTSRPYSDAVEILVPAEGVEIYVFGGPKPLDAVRRFNLFNGGGCLPPRWGLGFTQRVHRLFTATITDRDQQEDLQALKHILNL